MVELYLHSPKFSWHGAKLIKHKNNFTYLFFTRINMDITINLSQLICQ
jgi:hypothetical protein